MRKVSFIVLLVGLLMASPAAAQITVSADVTDVISAAATDIVFEVEIDASFGQSGIGGIILDLEAEPGLNMIEFEWLDALGGPDYYHTDGLPGPQTVFLNAPGMGVPLLPGVPVQIARLQLLADTDGSYALALHMIFAEDEGFSELDVTGDTLVIESSTLQACCLPDETCVIALPLQCTAQGGLPQGSDTTCADPHGCVIQACCLDNASCVELGGTACVRQDGSPQGSNTNCATTPCPPQACCLSTGECAVLQVEDCAVQGGIPQGAGSVCASACPPPQACCTHDGCQDLPEVVCHAAGGSPLGAGTNCASGACVPRACCFPLGSCAELPPSGCVQAHGEPQGDESTCDATECPVQPVAVLVMIAPQVIRTGVAEDLVISLEPTGALGETGIGGLLLGIEVDVGLNLVDFEWLGTLRGPDYFWDETLPGPLTVFLGTYGAGVPLFPGEALDIARLRVLADLDGLYDLDLHMVFASDDSFADEVYPVLGDQVAITSSSPQACCRLDETCFIAMPVDCTAAGGSPQGTGTTCEDPGGCAVQACCLDDASCANLAVTGCLQQDGTPQGADSDCATTTCPAQACCFSTGACEVVRVEDCLARQGVPHGAGSDCATANCPQPQACCFISGACQDLLTKDCVQQTGELQGEGSDCASTACPQPQACCLEDGSCFDVRMEACEQQQGSPAGENTECATYVCPPQACCLASGACADLAVEECVARRGLPRGLHSECAATECPQPQACCLGVACLDLLLEPCHAAGGLPQGAGTDCAAGACGPEACCFDVGSCDDLRSGDCVDQGGQPQGGGTSCNHTECPITVEAVVVAIEPHLIRTAFEEDLIISLELGPPLGELGIGGLIMDIQTDAGLNLIDFEWLGDLGGPDYFSDDTLPGPQVVYLNTPGEGVPLIPGAPVDIARLRLLSDAEGLYHMDLHLIFANDENFTEHMVLGDAVVLESISPRACCRPDRSCEVMLPGDCAAAGGQQQGVGSTCEDSEVCIAAACCFPAGSCQDLTFGQCLLSGGEPQGSGSVCGTPLCPIVIPEVLVMISPHIITPMVAQDLTISLDVTPQMGETGIGGLIMDIEASPGLHLIDFEWLGALAGPDYFSDDTLPGPQTVFLGVPGTGVALVPGHPIDVARLTTLAEMAGSFFLDLNMIFANDVTFGEEDVEGDGGLIGSVAAPEACCLANFACEDRAAGECRSKGGLPRGPRSNCDQPDVCVLCADASMDPVRLLHVSKPGRHHPYSGYIDPRLESSNGMSVDLGVDRVTLMFSEPVFPIGWPGGRLGPGDFLVRQTGGADPPNVLKVLTTDHEVVTVVLDRIITPAEWTTIIAAVQNCDGNPIDTYGDLGAGALEPDRLDIASLPGDVDQDGEVRPLDLLRLRQYARGFYQPQGDPFLLVDLDRDGVIELFGVDDPETDLNAFVDTVRGTGTATQPWAGHSLNAPQP